MTIRLLSKKDIAQVEPSFNDVLDLVEQAYLRDVDGLVDVPTKIGVHPTRANSFLDAMPAWVGGEPPALGMKWVSYFPGNLADGKEDSTGVIILNHPDHGHPVCIMEGMHVTFLRTAACAAIMARRVVRQPPTSLGLVGCGGLGKWTLRILGQAFPSIRTVYVASRTTQSRDRFCQEMSVEGDWQLLPASSVREAVENSDIVVSSVPPSDRRPIEAGWLRPDSVFIPLDLTNSWETGVAQQAARIVADNPEFWEQLNLKHRPDLGQLSAPVVPFQAIVRGGLPSGERSGISFLVVCGIASTDVTLGWEIYRRADRMGVGALFDLLGGKGEVRQAAEVSAVSTN